MSVMNLVAMVVLCSEKTFLYLLYYLLCYRNFTLFPLICQRDPVNLLGNSCLMQKDLPYIRILLQFQHKCLHNPSSKFNGFFMKNWSIFWPFCFYKSQKKILPEQPVNRKKNNFPKIYILTSNNLFICSLFVTFNNLTSQKLKITDLILLKIIFVSFEL
ncbi:hypothetical protein BpHYR1_015610 [Brachionus plicatilis]|uniref:Uncharacterized protein n=1 Tax=Brachionus plicatilis TaxID=10195 RepID=A0A3M7PSH9_BRAPC|nr:hypothetical protein BpHYR1_015610 [Brachionus plicatilis]